MKTLVTKLIRPMLAFTKLLDALFLERLRAILAGTFGNPAFPNPPIDAPVFQAAVDAYAAAITAALDGSKTAIAERHKQRGEFAPMLHILGAYVAVTSKGDMPTFLSSGFLAAIRTVTPPQPLSPPSIIRVEQGNTGQLLVLLKPMAKAKSYEIRYAALGAGGTPGPWTPVAAATVKQATAIGNLTPGTTYTFEARALGKLGFSDYGVSVERMAI